MGQQFLFQTAAGEKGRKGAVVFVSLLCGDTLTAKSIFLVLGGAFEQEF